MAGRFSPHSAQYTPECRFHHNRREITVANVLQPFMYTLVKRLAQRIRSSAIRPGWLRQWFILTTTVEKEAAHHRITTTLADMGEILIFTR